MPLLNYTTKVDVYTTLGAIQGQLVKHGAKKSCRTTTMKAISRHWRSWWIHLRGRGDSPPRQC